MSQIELILSRHGETEENKLHIMQGQLPGHLSELGKQQAEALAENVGQGRAGRDRVQRPRTQL